MRFTSALLNDIRYQFKYGFYMLYTVISAIYVGALLLCPNEYRSKAASIVILTDPAMLGMFFIGGIWLLEKEEGLHRFWKISPLRPIEYIVSKAISLSLISTVAAVIIALAGVGRGISLIQLAAGVFFGAFVFNIIGLITASYASSVNRYMIIATPPALLLSTPPVLAAFGISHPLFDAVPGMALWRIISDSIGMPVKSGIVHWAILLLWALLALLFAQKRIPQAMLTEAGEQA